jgi:hypothetical protein
MGVIMFDKEIYRSKHFKLVSRRDGKMLMVYRLRRWGMKDLYAQDPVSSTSDKIQYYIQYIQNWETALKEEAIREVESEKRRVEFEKWMRGFNKT